MGIFAEMNRRITRNMERHGHFLTDPHAAEEQKIEDAVDLLIPRRDRLENGRQAATRAGNA